MLGIMAYCTDNKVNSVQVAGHKHVDGHVDGHVDVMLMIMLTVILMIKLFVKLTLFDPRTGQWSGFQSNILRRIF